MATARHRATDLIRRRKTLERKYEELGRDGERDRAGQEFDSAVDEDVGDDLLGLMFMACHPVLSTDARVALTLRVLGGLTTEEIARGFLTPVPSIAQRIVRAKRTLTEARARFEVPVGSDRAARLASVLEVIYLIFNEG
jgi:predicted RNA polymerase sigma factor